MNDTIIFLAGALVFLVAISLKQINQYQRGVKFTFGRYSGIMQPGWRLVLPIIQSYQKVDVRLKAVDVPNQDAITKDNVSTKINAVIYYRITAAEMAVLEVEDYFYATSQLAQTTMRNLVGEVTLDELLSERHVISERIREIVDKATDGWGIKVDNVELKDIALPEDMQRVIARQAEAERERRAVITKAEGEFTAASSLAKAAELLAATPGALHLRTLNSINELSSGKSNTIVFALPIEIMKAIEGFTKK